jgi:glutamate-1-semialdehyde 2,1-aminomutase
LDVEKYAIYFKKMLEMGVYLPPSQYECLFLSSVIDEDDIEKLIISNRMALENIKDE